VQGTALAILPDAPNLIFKGIDLNATASTREVVLNAKGLTLDRVTLDGVAAQSVNMDGKLDRATLEFASPVAAGQHQLVIGYHGPILQGRTRKNWSEPSTPAPCTRACTLTSKLPLSSLGDDFRTKPRWGARLQKRFISPHCNQLVRVVFQLTALFQGNLRTIGVLFVK
jgi:hypothetical protein